MSSRDARLADRLRQRRSRANRAAGRIVLPQVTADRERLVAHLERVGMLKTGERTTRAQLCAMASHVLDRVISESLSQRDGDRSPRTS